MNRYQVELCRYDYEKQELITENVEIEAPSASDAWFMAEKNYDSVVFYGMRPRRIEAIGSVLPT